VSEGGGIGIIPIRRPGHCRGEDRQVEQATGQHFVKHLNDVLLYPFSHPLIIPLVTMTKRNSY